MSSRVKLPRRLIVATRNPHKAREIGTLLEGLPVEVLSLLELPDLPPVDEDRPTFAGNALKKAEAVRAAAVACGAMVLADDSGLEAEALRGLPGVHSARFAGPGADDAANNRLLLEKMEGLPPEKRGARFCCAVALLFPDGGSCLVEESCSGRIAPFPRGREGFGYDPLFICGPAGLTFGEMGAEEKNRVSHRGKALRRARLLIEQHLP